MALVLSNVQQSLSTLLQTMPLATKDKDGNPVTVQMDQAHADAWANALAQWILNVLTVQADVVNNNGAVVPVQVSVPSGTGSTVIPVVGKIV